MISVGIFINGRLIERVDAVNKGRATRDGLCTRYEVTDGLTDEPLGRVLHERERGAVALAKKLLEHLPEKRWTEGDELRLFMANMDDIKERTER